MKAIDEVIAGVSAEQRVFICGGDLSNRCHSQELRLSAEFISGVADALLVPTSQRFLVPGNHDVDWHLTKLATDIDPWYDAKRQEKFLQIIGANAPTFQFPSHGRPLIVRCPHVALQFGLLDSPFHDRHHTVPHRGLIGSRQLDDVKKSFEMAPERLLRVLVLHHHVTPFPQPEGAPDFSMLEDASELVEVARECGIALVLHGHQHRTGFQQLLLSGASLKVLGAGTATAPELPIEATHTFHVILFDDVTPALPCGRIETRILSTVAGWTKPLESVHRVPATRLFGPVVSESTLQAWAIAAIERARAVGVVKLDVFLSQQPEGHYISRHDFKTLIGERIRIQKLSHFRMLHDEDRDTYELQHDPSI